MATNFKQPGDVVELTAPEALTSGRPFIVGKLVAVALSAAASGAQVSGAIQGVYSLVKNAPEVWAEGVLLYWDDTAKDVTTTVGSNEIIGRAGTGGALSAAVVGDVILARA